MQILGIEVALWVIGALGTGFLVLAGLAVRKMTQKQLPPGDDTPEQLPEGNETLTQGEPEAEPKPPSEADHMRRGLEKTQKGFMAKLNALLFKGDFDEDLVDELEALLVTSDIGIRTTERLLGDLRDQLNKKEIQDPALVRARLQEQVTEILGEAKEPWSLEHNPTVIMVIGVNGVGKTTTIGKLAARYVRQGKKVVLGAGDTFRAAAVEQLEVWCERSGAEVIKGKENSDPSSVIFEAVKHANETGADLCLCDTAGRLHTKVNLMQELKKVRRVIDKAMPGAPHEVMLVLDATTGQNAITQARQFKEAVELDAIALTKLDGTAKGGVVVAICDELKVPVRFIGVGEQVDDLRDFNPGAFVEALFADASR